MASLDHWEHYKGREQTAVKHYVLRKYLQVLALKLGHFKHGVTINYVDGFSGPWDEQAEDLSDTSPGIAVRELSEARRRLGESGVSISVRCMFIEKEGDSIRRLADLEGKCPGVHITRVHGTFEANVPAAVQFATGGGADPFGFIFIDPTGWTGYGLHAISPLLRVPRCEVMVNFMTGDILRFIGTSDPQLTRTFVDLLGSEEALAECRALSGDDREDAVVACYCRQLKAAGGFRHVARAIVLAPLQRRVRFHLVYATRNPTGLIAFRTAERQSLPEHDRLRSKAQQHRRVSKGGQLELTPAEALQRSDHLSELCAMHRTRAKMEAEQSLRATRRLSYDRLAMEALCHPFVSEGEVKAWIRQWASAVQVDGLRGKQQPAFGRNLTLRWVGGK